MALAGSSSVPKLSNIDDVLAVAIECGKDLTMVSQYLLPALVKVCKSHQGKGEEVLLQAAQGHRDPLTVIDAGEHTIAYVYILATRATAALEDATAWQQATPFIDVFVCHFSAQQAHLENPKVNELALAISAIASKEGVDPQWGLDTLHALFHRFTEPIPGHLTTLHPLLAGHCLRTHQPDLAHQWVLAYPITDVSKRSSPLTPVDVIEYFYIGGCVYLQLGDWDQAETFFEQCLTVPAHSAHDRQVSADGRLILVQLFRDGTTKPLPTYISPPVSRVLRRFNRAYTDFADVYSSRDRSITEANLLQVLDTHGATYTSDGTAELIQSLLKRHFMRRVQRLGESFTRLSIRDVIALLERQDGASDTLLAEETMLKVVEELIATGQLQATLTPHEPSPILTFKPASTTPSSTITSPSKIFTSLEGVALLSDQMHLLHRWNAHLDSKEREIARSRRFVQKQQSAMNNIGGGAGGGPGGAGRGGMAGWVGTGAGYEDDFSEDIFA